MKAAAGRIALAIAAPLGFGIAPLLSLCKANPSEIPLTDLTRPLAASAAICFALLGLTTLLCRRSLVRGSVAASLLSLFGWFYADFAGLLDTPILVLLSVFPPTVSSYTPTIALALWLLAAGGVVLACARWRGSLELALRVMAPMSAALLLLAIPWRSQHAPPPTLPAPSASPAPGLQASSTSDLPDIYLVVLDAYGRRDVLKTLYDFDDGPLVDGLKTRGFQVAAKSRANYLQTSLAVGALFRLDYWERREESRDMVDTVVPRRVASPRRHF